jgi:predicted nucleotide-binding protein (sugar kinase/HSP70/actin superfamily)
VSQRVGIPNALQAYRYLGLWRTFLEGLGLEVVVSESTDRLVVTDGVKLAPAELCLPTKVFIGHLVRLAPQVDAIFLPRMDCRRVDGDLFFGCPKEMALPDMARALLPDLPPVIELVVDERERPEAESYHEVARDLGAEKDWRRAYREAMSGVGREIADVRLPVAGRAVGSTPLRVGVVGHEYLLNDALLTLDVVERLRRHGVEPVLAQSVESTGHSLKPRFMPNWMFERELIRAAGAMIGPGGVDGLLLVSSFACGTSAVTNELIRLMVHDSGREVPVLQLLFDEHTGEAGLATRLESFLDVLRLKRR